jgi:hypothetical protein
MVPEIRMIFFASPSTAEVTVWPVSGPILENNNQTNAQPMW